MRWSTLICVVLGLSFRTDWTPLNRLAAEEILACRTVDGPRPAKPPCLLRQNDAVAFQLVLGRIELDQVRYRKGSQSSSGSDGGTQTLCVDSRRGNPTLHYTRHDQDQSILLDVNDRGELTIESQRGSSSRVRARQTPHFGIEVSQIDLASVANAPRSLSRATDGPATRGSRASQPSSTNPSTPASPLSCATWLHLRAAEPELFSTHFEPLLNEMLFPYRLADLAELAESISLADLKQRIDKSWTVPDGEIENATLLAWIEALGSSKRAARIEAERNLLSVGLPLLPRLATLNTRSLDAEQKARLELLVSQLTPRAEDNAARLANLIRDDVSYWQWTANRLRPDQCQLVETRFQRLGTPLPFSFDSTRIASAVESSIR